MTERSPSPKDPATDQRGKRVLVGVTGGIGAYKSAELVRQLVKAGADVQVVMTEGARRFITPLTLQALSGKPVLSDLWDTGVVNDKANAMGHIELTRGIDAIVVAPASADFLARLAHGQCGDLLSTLCVARDHCAVPLLVAPAMNREMWDNPATRRNIAQLQADGVRLIGPAAGEQACGETGMGRMEEPELIADAVWALFAPKTLAGKRVMVTAGPTFEPIDPVRGITNRSSGKMGYAIAAAAEEMGAEVVLVSGPVSLPAPPRSKVISAISANDMFDAVMGNIADIDLFFAVAAVSDYAIPAPSPAKLKKNGKDLQLLLSPTRDILAAVAALPRPPFCVGFAAETENFGENAAKKREDKRIPVIVANAAQTAIGADDNEVTLYDTAGAHPLPRASKQIVARQIVAFAAHKAAVHQK